MTERETITCTNPKCKLVQFRTKADTCRRCKQSTAPPELPPPPVVIEFTPQNGHFPSGDYADLERATQMAIRARRRVSQRRLAIKMGCPRTYISKVEGGKAMPNLASLESFARGFGIPLWALVKEIEAMRNMLAAARKGAGYDVDKNEVASRSAVLANAKPAVDRADSLG